MRDHPERDRLGVDLVGVAHREAFQARHLVEDGIDVPLLLDPTSSLRQAYDIEQRFGWRGVVNPKGAAAYVRAWRRERDHSDPLWSETRVRPGLLLIGPGDALLWSRVGDFLGDYPSADEVLTDVSTALGT